MRSGRLLLILLVCVALAGAASLAAPARDLSSAVATAKTSRARVPALRAFAALPLSFEVNRGQTDPRVRFVSRGAGYTIFLTRDEAVLALQSQHSRIDNDAESALRLRFLSSNRAPQISGLDRRAGRVNYFIGSDPGKWRPDVPSYARVKYGALYPGIDLVYYGTRQSLEYDLIVSPGASPDAIRLSIDGAERARIDASGDLLLSAGGDELMLKRPRVYQDEGGVRRPIDGRYVLRGSGAHRWTVGFALADYDRSRRLVIDPQLLHSSFLGGSLGARANAVALDSFGNVYVTGSTTSLDFPTTDGAFQTVNRAAARHVSNVFVTVLNPASGQLVYSTYLGGGGVCTTCSKPIGDTGFGIAVDAQGLIYVAGLTPSFSFPTTPTAFERFNSVTVLGLPSGFVTVLNPSNSGSAQLQYSTYLGGPDAPNFASAIAVDAQGLVYVTGDTDSPHFPVTAHVFEPAKVSSPGCVPTMPGQMVPPCVPAAFVTILNPTESGAASLVYSSYLGGSMGENGNGVAVNSKGEVYVTGVTASEDFPTTANAFQADAGGFNAIGAFMTVINPMNTGASQLVYSTHLGGSFFDSASAIAIDSSDRAYVTGFSRSGNFPVTPGAFETTRKAVLNPFMSILDPSMSGAASLVYSTFLGGSGSDFIDGVGNGIAVDSAGLGYVTGFTLSKDLPVSANAFQGANAGGKDAFVTVIDPTMSGRAGLFFSSYLGGSGFDTGNAIAVDAQGLVYVTGNTASADFPVTSDAFQATKPGPTSAFVTVLSPSDPPGPIATPTPRRIPTPTPRPTRAPTPTPRRTPVPTPKKTATPRSTARPTPTPARHSHPNPTRTPAMIMPGY